MDHQHFIQVMREHVAIVAALKASVTRAKMIAEESHLLDRKPIQHALLLRMTEGLIAAHRAAKVDDDGRTLDLIEDALRHVGERLARETSDGREFRRKRLGTN